MKSFETILWKGIYLKGHEACRVCHENSEWILSGSAVFLYRKQVCNLSYQVTCDSAWHTLSADVAGWLNHTIVNIHIRTSPDMRWWFNGEEQPQIKGCVDIDLNFSPSTNLLPVRRLNLGIGEMAEINCAWLRFPSFTLETLSQKYSRIDEETYQYQSAGGKFVKEIRVNRSGLVIDYPGIWQAEGYQVHK